MTPPFVKRTASTNQKRLFTSTVHPHNDENSQQPKPYTHATLLQTTASSPLPRKGKAVQRLELAGATGVEIRRRATFSSYRNLPPRGRARRTGTGDFGRARYYAIRAHRISLSGRAPRRAVPYPVCYYCGVPRAALGPERTGADLICEGCPSNLPLVCSWFILQIMMMLFLVLANVHRLTVVSYNCQPVVLLYHTFRLI